MAENKNPDEIKINLKTPLKNFQGQVLKDLTKFPPNTVIPPEVEKNAPVLTLGTATAFILELHIQPTDAQMGWELHRLASKIDSKLKTNKGEMVLDKKQLQELIDYLKKARCMPGQIGPVLDVLMDYQSTLLNIQK